MSKINRESTYFVQMRPITDYGFVRMTSSSDEPVWTECKIIENRYKLDEEYKVEVKSIDERFGTHIFYQSDFMYLVREGQIIEKTSDTQHVEKFALIENVGGFEIIHEGYVIVD